MNDFENNMMLRLEKENTALRESLKWALSQLEWESNQGSEDYEKAIVLLKE